MSDDKVVSIKSKSGTETVNETASRIVEFMKTSGTDYKTGLIITLGKDGRLEYTPLGSGTDYAELLGVMSVVNQLILDEVLG